MVLVGQYVSYSTILDVKNMELIAFQNLESRVTYLSLSVISYRICIL
jgi:hypothetical protein